MRFKQLLRVLFVAGFSALAATSQGFASNVNVVGFGDSLMAGYQLGPGESFPERLEARLRETGRAVTVANAGVSGDTTSGGLSRLDWSVPDGTDLVILELGANDMLRGVSPQVTERNLDAMISRLKERGIAVVLMGMVAAPNLGTEFADTFNAIYPRLAQKHDVLLHPFFLEGVAADRTLLLDDGMHPNALGVDRMVEAAMPVIERALSALQ